MGEKPKTKSVSTEIRDIVWDGGRAVDHTDFHNANKYRDYLLDTTLIGAGTGLSWYALKALARQARRNRMIAQNYVDSSFIDNTYAEQDLAIQNSFIGASDMTKAASGTRTFSAEELNSGRITSDVASSSQPGSTIFLRPGQGASAALSSGMASNPTVWNSLAVAGIPLALLGSFYGGEFLSNLYSDAVDYKPSSWLDECYSNAKEKYDRAAHLLRRVTQEET